MKKKKSWYRDIKKSSKITGFQWNIYNSSNIRGIDLPFKYYVTLYFTYIKVNIFLICEQSCLCGIFQVFLISATFAHINKLNTSVALVQKPVNWSG